MTRKAFALGLLILLTFSLMSLPSAQAKDPVLINAAGATFPYPIYSKWFDAIITKPIPTSKSTTLRSAPARESGNSRQARLISALPTCP